METEPTANKPTATDVLKAQWDFLVSEMESIHQERSRLALRASRTISALEKIAAFGEFGYSKLVFEDAQKLLGGLL